MTRHLADLRGSFADSAAYEAALTGGNPLLYQVSAVEPATGDGQRFLVLEPFETAVKPFTVVLNWPAALKINR